MVVFIFVRHGESTDNVQSVWAGWKDAPLTNHGMNQAKAAGEYFSSTRLTAIHTSDLLRASMTAQAIHDKQKSPKPLLSSSTLLREQHFGVAEGKPYMQKLTTADSLPSFLDKGKYPGISDREGSFPEGESKNDLRQRAERAIDEILLPYVFKAAREGVRGVRVAIVSHGLCIKETLAALLARGGQNEQMPYTGLRNTAWARVSVEFQGVKSGESIDFDGDNIPPLKVRLSDFNSYEHLNTPVRQRGGIGSAAYDPQQKDIRAFFGGRSR
ncbi:phosphoglycerate mutase [Hymenopellis radicata]|nr:phosphoglycerate mutase [Hymenopellis radicata]